MRRRNLILTGVILLAAAAAVAGGLYALARREPAFYTAAVADDNAPLGSASEQLTRFSDLQNAIRTGQPEWGATFTAADLNAILKDQLDAGGLFAQLLPAGVKSPRVALAGDRLKVGARMQASPVADWAGDATTVVVHVELKFWVVRPEPNTVAVEVVGVWAGGLPVGSQRYLDEAAESARKRNIDVTWYRTGGNPVALLKFYADQPRPPAVVKTMQVADGALTIAGVSGSQ